MAPREARTYDGVVYASKAEARRASELNLLIRAGEIVGWWAQPTFRLGCPENRYRADFIVVQHSSPDHFHRPLIWVEDVKGYRTQSFARWVRLWRRYGQWPLVILTPKKKGWKEERIEPGMPMENQSHA